MSRYPAGIVAPFSLLVPVFGMPAAWLAFNEPILLGELVGAVLVVIGVLLGVCAHQSVISRKDIYHTCISARK